MLVPMYCQARFDFVVIAVSLIILCVETSSDMSINDVRSYLIIVRPIKLFRCQLTLTLLNYSLGDFSKNRSKIQIAYTLPEYTSICNVIV